MMTAALRFALPCGLLSIFLSTFGANQTFAQPEKQARQVPKADPAHSEKDVVNIHYLEIVTPKADETCKALEKTHGVTFGKPIADFGNARMAKLKSGGRIGVRAPMRETEQPVVRPYLLVEDIEAAVVAAKAAGGEFAMLPTEIPGQGKFAIYVLGGIEYGLWQL